MKNFIILAVFILVIPNVILSQAQVDKFTGDLVYNVPLTTLPHPSGRNLDYQLTYGSDVKVDQDAGPVGLGWSLNIYGFISRQVSGIPDDWDSVTTILHGDTDLVTHTGILYGIGENETEDIFQSTFRMDSMVENSNYEFLFPDYDYYQVVGYNMDGAISPKVLDYVDITFEPPANPTMLYTNKAHFYYPNDFNDSLNFRYCDWQLGKIDTFNCFPCTTENIIPQPPGETIGSPSTTDDYEGAITPDDFYQTENRKRLHTSRYIEYFTNEEIKDHNYGGGSTLIVNGFNEYSLGVTRSSGNGFDQSEIGAFRITDDNGYTYHYSLPLLVKEETHGSYDLQYDYSSDHLIFLTFDSTAIGSNGEYKIQNDTSRSVVQFKTTKSYAYKWLLTAITGPDFADDNDNGIVDKSDKGYWVSFFYSKSDFVERTPYLGHDLSYSGSFLHDYENNENLPAKHSKKLTQKVGRFSTIKKEIYTLDSVLTSTHKLQVDYFSRDDARESRINYEEKGESSSASSNYKKGISSLKIIENTSQEVISKVNLVQDYRLARGYYSNKNNTLSATSKYSSPADVQSAISYSTSCTNCGKLTLNEIEIYGSQNQKIQPDYLFDYDYLSTSSNPHYNSLKQDYWGSYRNSSELIGLGAYRVSSSDATAWSLRSVTEPIGMELEFTYESDEYEKVLDESFEALTRGAIRIFEIKDAFYNTSTVGEKWEIELQGPASDYRQFVNMAASDPARYTSIVPFTYRDSTCIYNPGQGTEEWETNPYTLMYKSHIIKSTDYTDIDTGSTLYIDDYRSSWKPYISNLYPLTLPQRICALDESIAGYYAYSGKGLVSFYYNEGTKFLGGGTRVIKITTKNGNEESYEKEYTYHTGIATDESSPYAPPLLKRIDTSGYYFGLLSRKFHKFQLSPMVGYSKVEEVNYGDNDEALGKTEVNFFTDPALKEYYQLHVMSDQYYFDFIYASETELKDGFQYVDEFTSCWGKPTSSKLFDNGNRVLSETYYDYESPVEGAFTEGFCLNYLVQEIGGMALPYYFDHARWFQILTNMFPNRVIPPSQTNSYPNTYYGGYSTGGTEPSDNRYLNVVRTYPSRLRQIHSYDQGIYSQSKVLEHDDISGNWSDLQAMDYTSNLSTISKVLAHQIPGSYHLGLKSRNMFYKNRLNHLSAEYSYPDSNLTDGDLGSATRNIYSHFCATRFYFDASDRYESLARTTDFFNKFSYRWEGELSEYGLFDKDEFVDFYQTETINGSWLDGLTALLANESGYLIKDVDGMLNFSTLNFAISDANYLKKTCTPVCTVNVPTESGLVLINEKLINDLNPDYDFERTKFEDNVLINDEGTIKLISQASIPEGWRKTNEVTLVNSKGKILESLNEHERYSVVGYLLDENIPYCSGYNTNYESFSVSSFEDEETFEGVKYSEGEVSYNGARVSMDSAHSGQYALILETGNSAVYTVNDISNLIKGTTYRASVWVKDTLTSDIQLTITTQGESGGELSSSKLSNSSDKITVGDWVLISVDLDIPETLTCSTLVAKVECLTDQGKIDDFRFNPLNAEITSTIVDPISGLKRADVGIYNFTTEYIYNSRDQLIEVWKDIPEVGRRKMKEFDQNYARSY